MRPQGTAEELERRRRRAVKLLREGLGVREVARMVGASPGPVTTWRQAYDRDGAAALKPRRHPGGVPKLSPDRVTVLLTLLARGAVAHGYANDLWTLDRVAKLIRKTFGVAVRPVRGVAAAAAAEVEQPEARAGRPRAGPGGRPAVPAGHLAPPQTRSAATGKPVVLIDESGFMLQPTVRRTWAPEGQAPVSRAWDRRDRWSVLSALTVSPARRRLGLRFDVWPCNVDPAAVLAMLRNLRKRHPRGFLLVLDRWSVHRSAVRQLLARGDGRIEVEWLPAYAPELNPVEQVWQRAKHVDLANFVPDRAEHLRREVEGSLVKTRAEQAILRSCFAYAKLKL